MNELCEYRANTREKIPIWREIDPERLKELARESRKPSKINVKRMKN